ncbi:MAG TPA: VanW family protein, partial [Oscillospiraceae bacterium]|nr:VanW family protein [Oscillospiraceae bacterium]
TTVLLIVIALTALAFSLNVGARVYRLFYGVKAGVVLEEIPMERLLEKEVREKVRQMAGAIDQAPQNARFEQSTMEVTPEVVGIKVDIETTVAAVMQAAAEEKVALVVIRLEPEVTAAVFRSINTKIASYHTSGGGSAGRTDNLYMAAKYMHGTVLAPGDIFSFNHVTGPRTFERGYSMAPVVGGLGIGGGVCQVATTVYNVALIAEMEIVERHPHSIRVGYVPPGKDATVTNYIDFKFRNSTDKFVQIRSGAGGGSVWVELWSQ